MNAFDVARVRCKVPFFIGGVINVFIGEGESVILYVVSSVIGFNPACSEIFCNYAVCQRFNIFGNFRFRDILLCFLFGYRSFLSFGILYNEVRNIAVTATRIVNDEFAGRNFAESGFERGSVSAVFRPLLFAEFLILFPKLVGSSGLLRSQCFFVNVYKFAVKRGLNGIFEIIEL